MSRLREVLVSRNLSGRVVFTGMYNRLTSMDVRGRQVAQALGAEVVRGRLLEPRRSVGARALVWVAVASPELVQAIRGKAPQIFDVINPSIEKGRSYFEMVDAFDALILNTRSTLDFLPSARSDRRAYVIPHHHCNRWRFLLPEERLARPQVVGYVGQPEHLHDAEAIRAHVESLGLRFLTAGTRDLTAYKQIDIGVAWTRPEELRDRTRSNIKLSNFCAFGIPSVVCNYESYRDVDATLGGGACLIADSLADFLESLTRLCREDDLRRQVHLKAKRALELYAVETVADRYRQLLREVAGEGLTD
ncbi:MAG TPA: hypothetical protein VM328_01540 [Fimbriimonadaceae bacterium]|nr:hypothetical protein [Fimbriimonadaceae bacterium]